MGQVDFDDWVTAPTAAEHLAIPVYRINYLVAAGYVKPVTRDGAGKRAQRRFRFGDLALADAKVSARPRRIKTPAPASTGPGHGRPTGAIDMVDVTRCGIRIDPRSLCLKPSDPACPFNLCTHHLLAITEWHSDELAARRRSRLVTATACGECGVKLLWWHQSEHRVECSECGWTSDDPVVIADAAAALQALYDEARPKVVDVRPVVYYLLFGDRIKIGTTTDLDSRLKVIPHDQVLAVEPGGHALERERHAQFAAHRLNGEWFAAHAALWEHVRGVRDKHGDTPTIKRAG